VQAPGCKERREVERGEIGIRGKSGRHVLRVPVCGAMYGGHRWGGVARALNRARKDEIGLSHVGWHVYR
jgi:hypothetical protein